MLNALFSNFYKFYTITLQLNMFNLEILKQLSSCSLGSWVDVIKPQLVLKACGFRPGDQDGYAALGSYAKCCEPQKWRMTSQLALTRVHCVCAWTAINNMNLYALGNILINHWRASIAFCMLIICAINIPYPFGLLSNQPLKIPIRFLSTAAALPHLMVRILKRIDIQLS